MTNLARPASLATLVTQAANDPAARRELRRQLLLALVPVAVCVALVAAWTASAPLSGAVIAPATIKVELNRKTVQHREGGIVREILVADGQRVRAGDPLVVVGDMRSESDLSVLRDQLHAERLRVARLTAEAALEMRFVPPAELADRPELAEHVARERALFAARRRSLDEQIASLQAQIAETRAQAAALATQISATESSARLADEELAMHEKLAREGYVQRTRLLTLQRAATDYRASLGEYKADAAMARQRAAELQSRIAQTRNQYQQLAADELKTASAKVRELDDRLRPSQDQVERQYVRAPVDGEVMALKVNAVGQVLGPRDPILDVAPAREKLVVEARIRPEDIDYVHRESPAEVRLTGFDAKVVPLPARVGFVSPDRMSSSDGRDAWFVATVEVDAETLQQRSDVRLQAGMPAEVYVTTAERTLLEYLAKPLGFFASRALREP
jgi:HlyD family type I secretion membrane fusion protein